MRVGSLVFATDQGLGILAKSFYDHGIVTNPLVVRHGRRFEHQEWFPGAPRIADFRQRSYYDYVRSMDVMLFFETPFDWNLFTFCREHKIKTVLMPMYECMPQVLPALPDMFLCPSLLDVHWAKAVAKSEDDVQFLPVPVEVPWRQRTHALRFVHNAGHGGINGRNGTQQVIDAWSHVKSPVILTVRMQEYFVDGRPVTDADAMLARNERGGRLEIRPGSLTYEKLWEDGGEGDVLLFPEKHNGLSLPLQEARAAGMLVMATDRFPMNTWLPTEPLIKPTGFRRNRLHPSCVEYEEAVINSVDIAAKIDEWFERDITGYSEEGKKWAELSSWANLGPKYTSLLEALCSTP
jgi:hypothetical protein